MAAMLVSGCAISTPECPIDRLGCDRFQSRKSIRLRSTNAALSITAKNKNNGELDNDDRVGKVTKPSAMDPACSRCGSKGSIQCLTCAGSGLYVESILESQGIITKVRCLGCGGVGRIMCPQCGGRCHT